MITKKEEFYLSVALTNEKIASEIVARIIDFTPANASAAQAILNIIKSSEKEEKQIREYLTVALTSKEVGNEIAEKMELIVKCLEYQAANVIENNSALNAAQAKIMPLSEEAKKRLVIAITNKEIAESIAHKIDVAGEAAIAIPDAV